ncbi:MAG: hypothetical protein HYX69_23095 [Planctomycetia bacterium]|nr:hypothetical protein [Planctomycetia bacterium]
MHEIAKLILEHADTLFERDEAIRKALYLGMPLNEIESYLDWLETVQKSPPKKADRPPPA